MFLERIASLAREREILRMVGSETLPCDFLARCASDMSKLLVQLVR